MKIHRSPGTLAALGAALVLGVSVGCSTTTNPAMDHWNIDTLQPRLGRAFLGYRGPVDGSYRDYHVRQQQDINLTLRRHFLNNNPENPFEAPDPVYDAGGRPPHSILPNPLNYVHLEGIAVGLATLALWDVFLPIPVVGIVASFQDGGGEEFWQGVKEPFRTGSFGGQLEREPPKTSEFKVRRP